MASVSTSDGWLQRFLEHRIGDSRMVRLLMKWAKAGVMEDGELHETHEGSPQGAIISPLLANIFLHYVFDLWAGQWRRQHARGEVYIVRYADDLVIGFQREQDAIAMHEALAGRVAKFGLQLHPDKTRVLEFGRFAPERRMNRGLRKPATFDFLGFTHFIGKSRQAKPMLFRRTSRKKRQAKLASFTEQCWDRRHWPVMEQHAWLCDVLNGHDRYYGVPTNSDALAMFHRHVQRTWYRVLQRRSQRARWTVAQRDAFAARFPLPRARIHHPWPHVRFAQRGAVR